MIDVSPLPPIDVLNQAAATETAHILVVRVDHSGEVFVHTSEQPEFALALADAAFRMFAALLDHEPNHTEH